MGSFKEVQEQLAQEGERLVVNPEGEDFDKLVSGVTHNNDLMTTDPAMGYTLRDRTTGEVLKYGETTLFEEGADGTVTQTRYSQADLKANNAEFFVETQGTKAQMHDWQHQQILDYIDANGIKPPLNFNLY